MRQTIVTALAAVALSVTTALAGAPAPAAADSPRVEKRFECVAPKDTPKYCAAVRVQPGKSIEIKNGRSQKTKVIFVLRAGQDSAALVERELSPRQSARTWTNETKETASVSLYLKSTDKEVRVRGRINAAD